MARIPKLDAAGKFLAADVNAQIDARTKATMRADLPALAKELKIGGGASEALVTTAALSVTEPGDFLADVATTLTLPDASTVTLMAGEVAAVRHFAGAWRVFTATPGAATKDETAPTAGTLTVATTETAATLSATGAMDDVALHATPYAWSKDNGATWTGWTIDPGYDFAGLTPGTPYTFRHKVRDAAGNERVGGAITKATAKPLVYAVLSRDDFSNVPNGTKLDGLTPTVGAALVALDNSGNANTLAQVDDSLAWSPAAAGAWQKSTGLKWSGLTAFRGVRVTVGYDLAASPTSAYVRFALPSNTGFSNQFSFDVKKSGEVAHTKYGGVGTFTAQSASPAPPVPATGQITFEATGAPNAAGWTVKALVNGVLHTTWTGTDAVVYSTALRTEVSSALTGTTRAGMTDFKVETAA